MSRSAKLFPVVKDYLYILIGCLITAAAMDVFLIPFRIAPGGITGIATVLYYLTSSKVPVGVISLVLNIPLFIGGMKFIGKRFFIKTLFSTIVLSVFIDALEPLMTRFVVKFLGSFASTSSNSNLLLYCVFGGVMTGVGLAIVFQSGATTGGTDLAAQIVHHFIPHFSIGRILLVIDAMVVLFAAIAFQSFLLGLYAIVTIFLASKVIDTILEGVDYAKAVFIISDQSEAISQQIMTEFNRGVTGLNGTGMYTKSDKKVLLCVMDRTQIPKLKVLVKHIDANAFVIVTDVREVLGEGFKTEAKGKAVQPAKENKQ
jgi:uncharacterized membrane-anchored protein YitT (DUF2179 family)